LNDPRLHPLWQYKSDTQRATLLLEAIYDRLAQGGLWARIKRFFKRS
jgi:hypothetical protein